MKKTINKKENFTTIHNKLINDSKISLICLCKKCHEKFHFD